MMGPRSPGSQEIASAIYWAGEWGLGGAALGALQGFRRTGTVSAVEI